MADMGQDATPPQEHKEYKGDVPMRLGKECGHHCGIITVGAAHSHERHCPCVECHDNGGGIGSVIARYQGGDMDPSTII